MFPELYSYTFPQLYVLTALCSHSSKLYLPTALCSQSSTAIPSHSSMFPELYSYTFPQLCVPTAPHYTFPQLCDPTVLQLYIPTALCSHRSTVYIPTALCSHSSTAIPSHRSSHRQPNVPKLVLGLCEHRRVPITAQVIPALREKPVCG